MFTPTATPLRALAAHLGPIISSRTGADLAGDPERCLPMLAEALLAADGPDAAARAVIVVDQFEELFTLCADESQRAAFINLLTLLAAPAPPLAYVVIGLRADFYADCAHYPQLRAALEDRQLVVGAMSPDELRETIIYPARDVGLDVDEGLTELLLSDLGATAVARTAHPGRRAGRLPLLAHALRRTWQSRSGTTLTVAGYQDIGGIRGALADTAEQAFTALDAAGRDAARLLFLRLVRIGDGRTEDARQRLTHAEAVDGAPDPRTAESVVDAFTQERLLTRQRDPVSDTDTVEITHEALLGGWPQLRDWINRDRAGLLTRQQLAAAAGDWLKSGRDPSALYRGTRLAVARDWADDGASPGGLDAVMDELLRASVELEENERRAVKRRTRRLRLLTGALAVLLVAALAAIWVVIDQDGRLRNGTGRSATSATWPSPIASRVRPSLSAASIPSKLSSSPSPPRASRRALTPPDGPWSPFTTNRSCTPIGPKKSMGTGGGAWAAPAVWRPVLLSRATE